MFAIFKTCDFFIKIATTSTSLTLSVTGFGLLVIPTGIACGLIQTNKVLFQKLSITFN